MQSYERASSVQRGYRATLHAIEINYRNLWLRGVVRFINKSVDFVQFFRRVIFDDRNIFARNSTLVACTLAEAWLTFGLSVVLEYEILEKKARGWTLPRAV